MGWFGNDKDKVEEEDKVEVNTKSKSGNTIILSYNIYAELKPKLVEMIEEYAIQGYEVKGWVAYPDQETAQVMLVRKK